jgi:hypothetical protein
VPREERRGARCGLGTVAGGGERADLQSVALFAGPQRLATNTRWNTAAEAAELRDAARRAGAFAEGSADSALLATLPPGD